MTKRILAASLSVLLGVLFTACGGDSSSVAAPTAVPTPPSRAMVTFNVDPNPVISEYQGGGWWKFKVNLEFYDTAGVGFAINSIRTTVTEPVAGMILLDYEYAVVKQVGARGREVLQFTSNPYWTLAGGGANIKFIASITDDKGNSFTLSNQATILRQTEEGAELQ